ncbi:hypothetical protein K6Y31_16940 [Motilimonas cestriensis]|uniref:Uncharacterized protein n=1 Tax=Motilimonas cestriensis TaxID=2742685 RepID=A0ABS8WBU2_9GAMM|nr:DUF6776 family protein [Motilimonas cestriensis]MCE2596484.1 hypothetical protein [Motilimonas cestriensis]
MKKLISFTWWAMLVGLGLSVGFLTGQKGYQDTTAIIEPLQLNIAALNEKNNELSSQLAVKNTALETEQVALAAITQNLTQSQNEIFELRKELAFYQKVLSPELMVGGVAIDSLNFYANDSHLLRYRLVLVQLAKERDVIKGNATFEINGINQQQETITLSLADLSLNKAAEIPLDFTYFQVIEGEIQLPEGMTAANVKLTINLDRDNRGKAQSWSADYIWSEVYVPLPVPATPEVTVEPTKELNNDVESSVATSVEPSVELTIESSTEPNVKASVDPTANPTSAPDIKASLEPTDGPTTEPEIEVSVELNDDV